MFIHGHAQVKNIVWNVPCLKCCAASKRTFALFRGQQTFFVKGLVGNILDSMGHRVSVLTIQRLVHQESRW